MVVEMLRYVVNLCVVQFINDFSKQYTIIEKFGVPTYSLQDKFIIHAIIMVKYYNNLKKNKKE